MKPDYDVIDDNIKRVNAILSRMPKIENRLDEIAKLLSPSSSVSIPVKKWTELVTERSNLRLELKSLEKELKEKYHLMVEESENIEINPYNTNLLI